MDAMRITKLVISLYEKGYNDRTIAKVLQHEMEHAKAQRKLWDTSMDMTINEMLLNRGIIPYPGKGESN